MPKVRERGGSHGSPLTAVSREWGFPTRREDSRTRREMKHPYGTKPLLTKILAYGCPSFPHRTPHSAPRTTHGPLLVTFWSPWTPSGSPLGSQVASPGPLLTPMAYFGDHFCGLWGEGGKDPCGSGSGFLGPGGGQVGGGTNLTIPLHSLVAPHKGVPADMQ